jgi:peptidoglycan/LPS O-acetylase OafA/YrhL
MKGWIGWAVPLLACLIGGAALFLDEQKGQLAARILVVIMVALSSIAGRRAKRPNRSASKEARMSNVAEAMSLIMFVGCGAMMYAVFVAPPTMPHRAVVLALSTIVCAMGFIANEILDRKSRVEP